MTCSNSKAYLDRLNSVLGPELYQAFLDLVHGRSLYNVTELEFARKAYHILKGDRNLVEGLVPHLPTTTGSLLMSFSKKALMNNDQVDQLSGESLGEWTWEAHDMVQFQNAMKPGIFELEKAKRYIQMVNNCFESDKVSYDRFVETLRDFKNKVIGFEEAAGAIARLFSANPQYIEGFSSFLNGERKVILYRVAIALKALCKVSTRYGELEYMKLVDETIDYIVSGRPPTSQIALSTGLSVEVIGINDVPEYEFPEKPRQTVGVMTMEEMNKDRNDLDQPYRHMFDVDKCERYGKSYILVPIDQRRVSSGRHGIGDQVLNDMYMAFPSGSEGNFKDSVKNPHEEVLFRVEDDEYELDVLIGCAQSTLRVLKQVQSRVAVLKEKGLVMFANGVGEMQKATKVSELIRGSLMPQHQLTINNVIEEYSGQLVKLDWMEKFEQDPGGEDVIGQIMLYLRRRLNEYVQKRRSLGMIWREVFLEHYMKSKDHQVMQFKQEDKRYTNVKSIASKIRKVYYQTLVEGMVCDYHIRLQFRYVPLIMNLPEWPNRPQSDQQTFLNRISSYPEDSNYQDQIQSIMKDAVELIVVASDKVLNHMESESLRVWLQNTLLWLLKPMEAQRWWCEAPMECNRRLFYGSKELYLVISLFHIIYTRLALARELAGAFDSDRWDFDSIERPLESEETQLELALMPNELDEARERQKKYLSQSVEEQGQVRNNEWLKFCSSVIWNVGGADALPEDQVKQVESIVKAMNPNRYWSLKKQDLSSPSMGLSANENGEWLGMSGGVVSSGEVIEDGMRESRMVMTKIKHWSPKQKYEWLITWIKMLCKGRLDQAEYEMRCLQLFGPSAYPLYSFYRVLFNTVLQIRTFLSEPVCKKWHDELLRFNTKRRQLESKPFATWTQNARALQHLELEYRDEIDKEFVNEDCYLLFVQTPGGDLHVTMIAPKQQPNPHSPIQIWKQYLQGYLTRNEMSIDVRRRRVFLPRNVGRYLPPRLQAEDWFLSSPSHFMKLQLDSRVKCVSSIVRTQCKIDHISYKICFVASSEDLILRLQRPGRWDHNSKITRRATGVVDRVAAELAKRASPDTHAILERLDRLNREAKEEELALVLDETPMPTRCRVRPGRSKEKVPIEEDEDVDEDEVENERDVPFKGMECASEEFALLEGYFGHHHEEEEEDTSYQQGFDEEEEDGEDMEIDENDSVSGIGVVGRDEEEDENDNMGEDRNGGLESTLVTSSGRN